MEAVLTGVASTTISKVVVDPVIELIKDVIQKEENRKILQADLKPMKGLVQDISTIFQDQQRVPLQTVKHRLEELQRSLTEAQSLLHGSEGRQRYLGCLVCKPVRLSKQIREWKVSFDNLYQHLKDDLSAIVNAQQIAKSAPQKALRQDVPTSGFDGSGINSAQRQVQEWVSEPQVRIVGIYGMAGVGKTSCLKMVYNNCINVYQHVIWVTVSADYRILDLQSRIAGAINLKLPSNSDIDTQKMMLSASMESKEFLLVLDDLWSRLDLQELGVAFGRNKHSKVLFSTRRRDLINEMTAEKSIEIQPLSPDESWTLFRKIAFNDDTVSVSVDIQQFAREMADECRGLPLALTVIASAMFGKTNADDWEISLNLMKTADPCFPDTHPRVDPELYQRLRLSYDALPTNVRNCFLYCAMYPEDAEIPVDELVQIWIAEGLVRSKQQSHLTEMAIGRSYINLLVDRCLFHNVPYEETQNGWHLLDLQRIRIHDVIRDMAIYIGEKEEKCIFKAGQHLQNFPEIHNDYYKRISLSYNTHIRNLPTQFIHPKLASLSLTYTEISEVPSGFLVSLTSLKVLDLSVNFGISSIPSSVGQLKQLEFLSLSALKIQDLPEEISHISSLQFLDLSMCKELQSLPSGIGKLKNLRHLSLRECHKLSTIPHEISQLTSLSTLDADGVRLSAVGADSGASIWRLKSLTNLRMLRIYVRVDVEEENWASSGMEVGIMGNWLEMRHLAVSFQIGDYRDDVMEDVLPEDMQKMSKLQSFTIYQYPGSGLPEYTCNFEHLECLNIVACRHLRELSPLERLPNLKSLRLGWLRNLKWLGIGQSGRSDGYSRLEKLEIVNLERLESIAGPPNNDDVWNDTILPHLRVLDIRLCSSLKRLPKGMEKLRSLRSIVGEEVWWEGIHWVDDNMKSHLQSLFTKWY